MHTHTQQPLTHAALPIDPRHPFLRFIEGAPAGAAPAEGGTQTSVVPAAPAAASTPTPADVARATQAAQQAQQPATPAPKLGDDPYVRSLRDEAAANRVAAKEAKEAAAKAQEQLDTLQTQLRARDLADKVRTIAAKPDINGRAAALLDSKALSTKLAKVDPSDDAAIEAAIKGVLDARPDLKNTPTVPASSGSTTHTGGAPSKHTSLDAAVAAAYTKGK